MSRQQPGSVTNAIRLLMGLVALSGLTVLLTILLRDDLVRSWADGNEAAREILQQGGLDALDQSSIHVPAFVPVAVVMFVVFALLVGVLVMFFRDGHDWARLSLGALVLFTAVGWLAWLRTGPPAPFVVISVLSIVLDLVLLVFLWHRDTSAFIRGAWLAAHPESAESADPADPPGSSSAPS
jgi:hypothetical protein